MRRFGITTLAALLALLPAVSRGEDLARRATVRISCTIRHPDTIRPWTKGPAEVVTGSGAIFKGKRILTSAHTILYASQIQVQADRSSEKFAATVVAFAPGIDLALLKLEDESFFDKSEPLELAEGLPKEHAAVAVYGYPSGGNGLSVTKGIVSRIEFAPYGYLTHGLRIQVDAAINPGNSGGPALVEDRLIGLAFSRLGGSDNIGYIIPAEEIKLFLEDCADGKYDGKPIILDEMMPLDNPALRAKYRVSRGVAGQLVTRPFGSDPAYPLRSGDVITRIGGKEIDNSGLVRLDGGLVTNFHYMTQRAARDGLLKLTILRDGKELGVDVPVGPGRDRWLIPYLRGGYPSYFIYGPLIFSEATDEYVNVISAIPGLPQQLGFLGNPLVTRYGDRPAFEGERLVVVSHPILDHRIGQGYPNPFAMAIASVNGTPVKNLGHLVGLLRDCRDEFVEFRFVGNRTPIIVFRRQEVAQATEEVLIDNGIRKPYSDDLAPIWKKVQPGN